MKTKKDNRDERKKVLESEMKYKAAYYNYEDLKKKMDEKRCADEQTRKKIITTHAELKKKLKNLINEADNEFISVV